MGVEWGLGVLLGYFTTYIPFSNMSFQLGKCAQGLKYHLPKHLSVCVISLPSRQEDRT